MATITASAPRRKQKGRAEKPLRLKSRDEATKYLAAHLTPVGHNPRGYPIYAKKDIDALNIILPEDDLVGVNDPKVSDVADAYPPTVEVDMQKLFAILTASWKSDMHVQASSDPGAVEENPAFQMTIALGKKVVPLIFKEYEQDNDVWGIALRAILGFSPVLPKHRGRIDEVRADWLKWGKANGYL